MSIFNTFRAELDSSFDVKKLTKVCKSFIIDILLTFCFCKIAFHDLNPFPQRLIKNKREHHHKIIQVNKKII